MKSVVLQHRASAVQKPASRRLTVRVKAGPREDEQRGRPAPRPSPGNKPTKGFFAPADPKAAVYSPIPLQRQKDFTKKGGRWDEEFIWNTNWQEQLKYEEDYKRQQEEEAERAKEEGGFLAISRLGDLNDPNVDLSEQLRQAKLKREAEERAKAERARRREMARPKQGSQLPARFEQKRLSRSSRFNERVVAVEPTEGEKAEREAQLELERKRYEELKQELSLWTLGLTGALLGATYAFYSREVAASYGLGALGGYFYLRLLNKSVDSIGGGGAGGGPRLAIPVILVLGFNRFNEIKAEELGITLQLLPMLAGFFTYKAAVIFKNFSVLARELVPASNDISTQSAGSTAASTSADGAGSVPTEAGGSGEVEELTADERAAKEARRMAALSVDRAFREKILKG